MGSKMEAVIGSSYTRLELLRVLDLSDAEFRGRKLASGIGRLIHLRYLSLKDAKVSHLPYLLGNLKLLIYLDLDICTQCLNGDARFEIPYVTRLYGVEDKVGIENLVKLESMKNFSTMNSRLEDLCGMLRLMTLTIKLFDETSMETLSASIGGMRYLENLNVIQFWRRMKEEIKLDFVWVKKMSLRLRMPRLPKEEHFPSRLTVLKLCLCRLKKDPMPILEKLLQLKLVWLDFKSFSGRRMVCSGSGFPQLQELTIWGLNNWEEWIVQEGSMPLLHSLRISRCQKLKELPDGMRFITSLKILSMDEKWKKRLSEEGKDYYKVRHVPSVKFIGNDRFQGASRRDLISSIL